MTQAKAATVASALISAGHFANVLKTQSGDWVVHATPGSGDFIPVDTVKSFQDTQAITGNVHQVVFT